MRKMDSLPLRDAICLLLMALLLAGCAAMENRPVSPAENALTACRTLYREVDASIEQTGVRDQGPALVPGFPYLRTTRLLASFRDEITEADQWSAWVGHMASLDAMARKLELRNLAVPVASHPVDDTLPDELDRCRERLLAADLAQPQRGEALRAAARVPDDYVTWWRVAGIYPLTAPIVSANIATWHAETRATFATPLTELPVTGELMRWSTKSDTSMKAAEVSEILRHSRDPIGIPQPAPDELERLFEAFAPIWEVDVVNDDDRIGLLRWDNAPMVDVARPTLYRKVSHTRFGDQVLLQLNYIVWFPARSGNDIYAGRLDGINWRVTFGPDGEPWMFDAMHNCGCYHEYFPTSHLRLRGDLSSTYSEPPLLPQSTPEHQPLVLRIGHHSHLIQHVYHDASPRAAQLMAWEDYDALRSLPAERGHRSLFGEYGLVAGTERRERFLLWPMGIRSPGAMRQWGRHATAFVGRRHFDDPFLIESLFEEIP